MIIALEFGFLVLGNFIEIYSPETGVLGKAFAQDYHAYYKGFYGIFFIQSDAGMKLFIWSVIAVMIILASGFYPRIMALIGCILLSLFFNRYSLLYFGWEMYACVMLFWLVIIPSGSFFSFFGIRTFTKYNKSLPESSSVTDKPICQSDKAKSALEWNSPLSFALLFQIGIIYFYNGISKNGELWMNGHAIDSFLSEVDKARASADWLLTKPVLSCFLNYSTLIIEIGLVFILFIPWKNKRFRYAAAFLILALHWGIDIFVDVGNFKYVASAVAILLLPGEFWDKIGYSQDSNNSLQAKIIPVVNLPVLNISLGAKKEKILAWALCGVMLFSNLSQTNASMTNDRMKQIILFLHVDSLLKMVNHHLLPQYSFFTQYWHLYSPDPPKEKGYMLIEVITESNDTMAVFNGVPLINTHFYSKAQHNLFTYLTLKKGRNQKEKIAEKYLVLREIRMWNKQKENTRLKLVQLVIYSYLFDRDKKSLPAFKRTVYKSVDVKYR